MGIRGVFPPIATPFDADGRIDADALAHNIRLWDETGLTGYVVAGSNGESALLTPDEVVTLTRIARQATAPGRLIITGTGLQSTAATIALTRSAAEAGADAVLVMTPSFFGAQVHDAAMVRHYEAVADASPVPVLAYNVPKFTHLNLSPETVARMAPHPNIVGVKDSAGDIGQLINLRRLCPDGFSILIGNAGAYVSGLQIGADGGILALANVAPRECVAIRDLVAAGQAAEAARIQFRMMPVARAVTTAYGIAGLKAALDLLGYRGGAPRPPLRAADEPTRDAIRRILQEAELLR
ncbi:MAG TPA: dihydrodipicolinate synthase family protein [Chloroflexi bacterium]|jgi:4-hydroxy-2-oxoglutarate aldolase|nr:dihydrodipicolinate synthase family protein [Chloroflexota bacterium]